MSCSWKTLGSCKDGRCGVNGNIEISGNIGYIGDCFNPINNLQYETCIDDPLLKNKQGSLNKVNCLVSNLFTYIQNTYGVDTWINFISEWNKTNIKPCLSGLNDNCCNYANDYVFVQSMFIYFSLVGQNKNIITTTEKYCCQCIISYTIQGQLPYKSCVKAIDFAKLFCCLTNKCCTTSTNCCCGCSSSSDDKVQDYINDLKDNGNYLSNLLAGFIQNAHNNQTLTYLGIALNYLQFDDAKSDTDCSKICSHTNPKVATWTEKNQILFIKSKPSNSFDIHPSLLCKIPIKINISKLSDDKHNSANDVVQVSFKQVALVEDLDNFLNAFVNILRAGTY